MKLGAIALPRLKVLDIQTPALTRENLASINGAAWPSLASPHLGLGNAEFEDGIVQAVVNAPILAQLKTLSLSKGMMSDAGAEILLASEAALAHLEWFAVHENYLSRAMVERLEATFGDRVRAGRQRVGGRYRSVAVAE